MYTYHRTLLLTILLSFFVHAQELFINQDGLNLAHITLSETYCKNTRQSQHLCQNKKLSYIDYDDAQLPTFLEGIKAHIAPVVEKYKAEDLKKTTLENVTAMHGDISGDWNNESTIDLFAKTPTTYTLSTTSSGYEGGAHGYYVQRYDNYNTTTHTKFTLDELFLSDYNQTLHRVAKAHYKALVGLTPNQPLTDDGWFQDKFVLAENFAITSRGLHFFYNQYEIKPYAAGPTEFMLPYYHIKKLINPKGPLGFVLKDNRPLHAYFKQEEQMSFEVDGQVQKDGTVKITAKMQNFSYHNKGWFSLSFPQLSSKSAVVSLNKQGFTLANAYPKGSKIYNQELKKAIRSDYLLVEGEDSDWNIDKVNTITLTLTPPAKAKQLILDIRGNLKSKATTLMLPDEYNGVKGQQGFTNYRVFIEL